MEKQTMKNKIAITLAVMFCLIGISSAYYPGETIVFDNPMGIENLVYTIINNDTAISDFEVEINSTNIIVTFPMDMPPNSFDIVFIEEQIKEVVVDHYSGGGGGTKTIYKNRTVYEDRDVETVRTEYVDKEVTVEVPSETIFKNSISKFLIGLLVFAIIILGILLIIILGILLLTSRKKENYDRIEEEEYD